MSIPQAAVDAAAERFDAGPGFDVSILARYALEAAMPHLRKQVAADIRDTDLDSESFNRVARDYSVDYANGYAAAIEHAARIAEGDQS